MRDVPFPICFQVSQLQNEIPNFVASALFPFNHSFCFQNYAELLRFLVPPPKYQFKRELWVLEVAGVLALSASLSMRPTRFLCTLQKFPHAPIWKSKLSPFLRVSCTQCKLIAKQFPLERKHGLPGTRWAWC